MSVQFIPAKPCESIAFDAKEGVLSPSVDLRQAQISEAELRKFTFAFTAFYYGYPGDDMNEKLRFVEDLEGYLYTEGEGGEVPYGRIFVDKANPKETGISDRGLTVYFYIQDLTNALGLHIKETSSQVAPEDCFLESETVGEMIAKLVLILSAYGKLQKA